MFGRGVAVAVASLLLSSGLVQAQDSAPDSFAARLPDWLSINGSARVRPEGKEGREFVEGNAEGYTFTRLRLDVGLEAGRWARFFVEGQDSRAPGLPDGGPNLRDPIDFYQGYAELGTRAGLVRLRVGRQEMQYGQQRLISVNPFRNTGRSFDAARVMVGTTTLGVDVFASAIVEKDPDGLDHWVDGEALYGGYGRIGQEGVGLRVEPYLLVRTRSVTRSRPLPENRFNLGARLVHQVSPQLDWTAEVVRQFGDAGDASVSAWMAYGIVGYDFDGMPWRPRLEGEYSHSSGDPDPEDGRLQGFDTMYRTPHRFHGYADLIGGRNLRNAHAEVTLQPASALSVAVDLHRFWLATRMDGLYSTSLAAVVPAPARGFGTSDVGVEFDVTVTYDLREWLTVGGGWSHFLPGRVVKEGASANSSSFTYGLVEVRF